ncbi:MAG: ADP-glyceromanno-heptose 6-epimerase [Verrucomicrobia bacterium]|nr:ADP-glyceromanno-heptose 6-epimerase [Verrucomicrobiota bacterium]
MSFSPLLGKILVTGGAGFIGSALVWELNRRGCENIVVADFLGQDEKWKNLVPLRFDDYLEADELLRRVQADDPGLGMVSCVFHLGACSATTERDAAYLIRNNFEYTRTLAGWAQRRGARFVYASSAATYGDGSAGMSDAEPAQNLPRLRPLNMYGYSKHLFDLHAWRHGLLDRIVGLKYFNVFGPNEGHKGDMRSLVHKAYGQIVETGRVQLFKSYHPDYADGEQRRDFLYVKDAVNMTLALAENPDANGLFNLGSGEANTWLTLASAIFSALDREPHIEFIEMPDTLRGKYQYFTQADIARLRAAWPECRVTALAAAVRDYVRNYIVLDRRLGDEI